MNSWRVPIAGAGRCPTALTNRKHWRGRFSIPPLRIENVEGGGVGARDDDFEARLFHPGVAVVNGEAGPKRLGERRLLLDILRINNLRAGYTL